MQKKLDIHKRGYTEAKTEKAKKNNGPLTQHDECPILSNPRRPSNSNYKDTTSPNLSKQDIHRFVNRWNAPIFPSPAPEPTDKSGKDEIIDNVSQNEGTNDYNPVIRRIMSNFALMI